MMKHPFRNVLIFLFCVLVLWLIYYFMMFVLAILFTIKEFYVR